MAKKEEEKKEVQDNKKKQSENTVDEQKKSSVLMPLLIIIIGLLIVSGGAFSITKYVIVPKYTSNKVNAALNEKTEPKKKKKDEGVVGEMYEMEPMTVNSKDSEGRRFIIAKLAIESSDSKVIEELKLRDAQIKNEALSYLKEQTIAQVLADGFQDSSKKYFKESINSILIEGEVDSIYFTQLLVQ